jgi:hypothetical protein
MESGIGDSHVFLTSGRLWLYLSIYLYNTVLRSDHHLKKTGHVRNVKKKPVRNPAGKKLQTIQNNPKKKGIRFPIDPIVYTHFGALGMSAFSSFSLRCAFTLISV